MEIGWFDVNALPEPLSQVSVQTLAGYARLGG
jgi:hypothetical protein